ncbi:MAG: FtsX-like permease family protein [Deltaproteobacteria bacterium]
MGMLIQIAARNLVKARLRTLFLGSALTLVTALLILLLALSQGVTDTMIRSATTLASGHVNVAGWFKAKVGDSAPLVTQRDKLRKIVEENTPGLDFVVDRGRGWGRVISDTSSLNAGLTGIDIDTEARLTETLQLAEENEYVEGGSAEIHGKLEDMARTDGMLLFAAQAKRLEVRVGDVVTVTVELMSGARNTAEFTVVAIAKDLGMMSNWSVFVNSAGIRKLYALSDDVTGALEIHLEDHTKATEVMKHLTGVFEENGYEVMDHDPQAFFMKFETVQGEDWTGQKLDLTIWRDEVSYMSWLLLLIDAGAFLLMVILSLIIAVGITNSMMMSVRERTSEIGTLRAIGMSRSRVLLMFLTESLLLGLGSTLLGGLLGMGLAYGLNAAAIPVTSNAVRLILMSDTLHLVVTPGQLVLATLAFSIVASLAAFLPAFRASRLQPVKAIQHAS